MKRSSVTITDDLEQALEAYNRDQDLPPRLVDLIQAALREYLAKRGYISPPSHGEQRKKPKGLADAPKPRSGRTVAEAVIEDRR
jgi:hypothetical protein